MKHLKTFENINNHTQQLFYLSKGDVLYLSDDFVNRIKPTANELKKNYKNNQYYKYVLDKQKAFFNDERNEKGYRISTRLDLLKSVTYDGMYRMNIVLFSRQEYLIKDVGKFKYYIGGNSGDYDMHGKNMIRATRECNLNFIALYYPIVKHIKDFYKKFKNDELLFDIVRKAVRKNPEIAKYGIPEELQDELGHYETSIKYNI